MKISAIIIDDEKRGRRNLSVLLSKYCQAISVVGEAESAAEGRLLVEKYNPEVVFLDIQMPEENGFQFLESINNRMFSVIFVTAFDSYGIQAVKASAIDYLVKPIDPNELVIATGKLIKLRSTIGKEPAISGSYQQSIEELIRNLKLDRQPERLTLPHGYGFVMVEMEDIIRAEAKSNYCVIYLKNGERVMLSKGLKEIEDILPSRYFVRINRSDIINILFIKEYSRVEGGIVCLKDGFKMAVSRRRSRVFIQKVRDFSEYSNY